MRWRGFALLAFLSLPGLSLPYARRTKTTIGPPSSVSLGGEREEFYSAPPSVRVIVISPPMFGPLYPPLERPCVIQPVAPVMGFPAIYPLPIYAPSQPTSVSLADLLFLQALERMDRRLERIEGEVSALKEQVESPRCPACGRPMKPEWKVCPYDGTPLTKGPGEEARAAPEPKPPSKGPEEGRPSPAERPPEPAGERPKPLAPPEPAPKAAAKEAEGWVIDWDRNVMTATGRASLEEARGDAERARRTALERAYASLREGLLDLWGRRKVEGVDPYTWAAELSSRAKVVRERELPDGTWEVEVELKFGEAVPESGGRAEVKPSEEKEPPKGAEGGEGKPPARREGPFTGLIVDARGLGLKPAMSPKIWDEKGRLVWQKIEVSTEFMLREGIVAYARSMEEALKSPRAGKNPLVIRAKGVRGPFKADPVISAEDADLVLKEDERTKFLERCNVVFVID